jgi:hypothetical protein
MASTQDPRSRIIAGHLTTQDEAGHARAALMDAGFRIEDITTFFNNPPGMHDELPAGGDEPADPQARGVAKGTATGAAIGAGVGFLAGLTAGPAAPVVAGVGAYVGALAGTASATEDEPPGTARRPAGMMVAVNVRDGEREAEAVRVLRACGVDNLERAEGLWEAGEWTDFSPVTIPHLIDQEELHAPGTQ